MREATLAIANSAYNDKDAREEAYMKMNPALLDVLGRFVQDGVNLTKDKKDGA